MGEIADAMLEGDLCTGCGCFIDEGGGSGFPRYCSAQCAKDFGGEVAPRKPRKQSGLAMRKRDVPWLAATAEAGGALWDRCPAAFARLKRLGYARRNNERITITEAGRAALAKATEAGNEG